MSGKYYCETSGSYLAGITGVNRKSYTTTSTSVCNILCTQNILFFIFCLSIAKPVTALAQWARALDSENLSQPPPDFPYPELNELAGLIRTSLSFVQDSLEREHRFLRHASHELRTPIAIIRNNIELLHKLKDQREPERTVQQQKVIDRIDRAGLTMQHLTETLLWLSKDEIVPLAGQKLDLPRLLQELVEEMTYLLSGKEVQLMLTTDPCTIFLP